MFTKAPRGSTTGLYLYRMIGWLSVWDKTVTTIAVSQEGLTPALFVSITVYSMSALNFRSTNCSFNFCTIFSTNTANSGTPLASFWCIPNMLFSNILCTVLNTLGEEISGWPEEVEKVVSDANTNCRKSFASLNCVSRSAPATAKSDSSPLRGAEGARVCALNLSTSVCVCVRLC